MKKKTTKKSQHNAPERKKNNKQQQEQQQTTTTTTTTTATTTKAGYGNTQYRNCGSASISSMKRVNTDNCFTFPSGDVHLADYYEAFFVK